MRTVGPFLLTLALIISGAVLANEPAHWRNRGYHYAPKTRVPFKAKWISVAKKGRIFKYKRREFSSPFVFGELLFLGSDNGTFYAIQKSNGHKKWRFKANGTINSKAIGDGRRVYFGDDKGILYALESDSGKLIWERPLGSEILSAPVIEQGRLYLAASEGQVYAIDASDGRTVWQVDHLTPPLQMAVRGNSPPVLDGRGRLYLGFSDGTFRALSTRDGRVVWEKRLMNDGNGFSDLDAPPLIEGDNIYLSLFDGPLYALSLKSGNILWSRDLGSGVSIVGEGKTLFVSGSRGSLYALNKADGEVLWETKVGEGALTAPVVYQNILAVGLSSSTMNFFERETGKLLYRRFTKKGISSDPAIDEGRLYYFSNGGRLYSLKLLPRSP
ncbi:MAG: PQQ-binding-like beta-propeller repeat protein [Deltaproteobacteria bacterium]|nr:PQQ-binding-like beta-propeller repeat protein [Deltaproteobacteria bacterium]